jgi:hypothetical protein
LQAVLKRPKNLDTTLDKAQLEYQRLQDHLLAMLLMQPKIRPVIKGCKAEYFTDGSRRRVYKFLQDNPGFKGDPKIAEQLQSDGDYVKIVMLQFEELYQDLALQELQDQAEQLKHRLIDRYVKIQKHNLANAMQQTQDDKELTALMTKVDKLNTLIK